jgi:ATP-binding cassette subfamily B protein
MPRRSFRRGMRLAWEANRRDFVIAALLCAVAAAVTPVEIWLGKRIVDLITIGHHTASDALPVALALGLVFGFQRALGPIRNGHQQEFGELVQRHVTRTFLTKAATVDLGYLDDARWHDAASRARRDMPWMPAHLTFTTFELLSASAGTLAMLGLVVGLHPVLGLLLLVSIVPWVVLQRQTNRLMFEFRTGQTPAERERMYVSWLLAEPAYAKDVRSYGLASHLVDRYLRLTDEVLAHHTAIVRRSRWLAIASALVTAAAVGGAYQFIAARGLTGSLTPGVLTATIAAFTAIASQGNVLAHLFGQMGRQLTFLDDYFTFVDMPALLPVRQPPLALPAILDGGIRLDGVRFAYPAPSRTRWFASTSRCGRAS